MPYSEFGKAFRDLVNAEIAEKRKYLTEKLLKIKDKIRKKRVFEYSSYTYFTQFGIEMITEKEQKIMGDLEKFVIINKNKINKIRFNIKNKKKKSIKKNKKLKRLQNLNFKRNYEKTRAMFKG